MALTPGNSGMTPKQRQLNPLTPRKGSQVEKDISRAAWEENANRRERSKIEARGAERLQIAEERYKAFRGEQQANRDHALELLQKDISNAQAHLWKTHRQTESALETLEAERQEQQAQEKDSRAARQNACQQVNEIREADASHSEWTFAEIEKVRAAMEEEIDAIKQEAHVTVHDRRKQAAEHRAQVSSELAVRQSDADAFVKDAKAKTTQGVLAKETHRHRAAAQVDRVGELHQATKTQMQTSMKLHEQKSKQDAKEFEQITHQVRLRTDKALAEKMMGIVMDLQLAKEFCYKLKSDLVEQSYLANSAVAEVEEQAAHEARESERKLHQLQSNVLAGFHASCRTKQAADDQMQASRDSCKSELEALESRYQTVNDETRDRVKAMLAQWAADRDFTDQAIRRLEKQGKDALEELGSSMTRVQRSTESKEQSQRDSCVSKVDAMKRQALNTESKARQAAEEKRLADDEAAAAALAEMQRLKEQIEGMQMQTDHAVEGFQMKCEEEEQQLQQQAEVSVNMCKQMVKHALEEEKVYLENTSAAWARIRKVSYKLRLANLHDFANGIINGEFDHEFALKNDATAIC